DALSFVFIRLGRPPRSPLFPYTTLFRSAPAAVAAPGAGDDLRHLGGGPGPDGTLRLLPCRARGLLRPPAGQPVPGAAHCRGPLPDRKSTRLNSSHDQISYAVFCLKKKKK